MKSWERSIPAMNLPVSRWTCCSPTWSAIRRRETRSRLRAPVRQMAQTFPLSMVDYKEKPGRSGRGSSVPRWDQRSNRTAPSRRTSACRLNVAVPNGLPSVVSIRTGVPGGKLLRLRADRHLVGVDPGHARADAAVVAGKQADDGTVLRASALIRARGPEAKPCIAAPRRE